MSIIESIKFKGKSLAISEIFYIKAKVKYNCDLILSKSNDFSFIFALSLLLFDLFFNPNVRQRDLVLALKCNSLFN